MTITVEPATDSQRKRWDDLVSQSPSASVFHQRTALGVVAEHSDGDLTLLVGTKGEEPVGLFPVFALQKGPVQLAFSPPPRLGVPRLGPTMLNVGKLKQRKRERATWEFLEGAIDWIDERLDPKFVHVRTPTGFDDVRPFSWQDFDVGPRYTYELDLEPGREAVMDAFKKNLRSDIRRHEDAQYEVREGGEDAIEFTLEQVRERYEAQDKRYHIDPDYVLDLYRSLPAGQVQPYVGIQDGEWLSGIVVLRYGSRLSYWQGGGKPDAPLPINDLVQWRIIRGGIDSGATTYDLLGANTRRIAAYKSKFNPELVPYFEAERGSRTMSFVSDVYRKFR